MSANVRLHIDRLVLHGFEGVHRGRLHAALETELARLFSEHGVPAHFTQPQRLPRLDAGALRVSGPATPEHLGTSLAQTIFGGFSR